MSGRDHHEGARGRGKFEHYYKLHLFSGDIKQGFIKHIVHTYISFTSISWLTALPSQLSATQYKQQHYNATHNNTTTLGAAFNAASALTLITLVKTITL